MKTLKDLIKIYGNSKKIIICKEITKIYENINYESLSNQLCYFSGNNNEKIKGEFIFIIPKEENKNSYDDITEDEIEIFLKLLLKNEVFI